MNVKYIVRITEAERETLKAFVNSGSKVKRAPLLVAADQGYEDQAIAQLVGVGTSTVYRGRRRLVERPIEVVLDDEARPRRRRNGTGKEAALLVAWRARTLPALRSAAPFRLGE
ncbi:MAG: helix-turn-helix domain-containing protein [Deltaproteobacteria bacterium]